MLKRMASTSAPMSIITTPGKKKPAHQPRVYPPKYQSPEQIEFYKNNPKPAYYDLFYNEIQYEVNIEPLEHITNTIMDIKDTNFSYFDHNSLAKFAWLYRPVKYIFHMIRNYLHDHQKLTIDIEEFATIMFLGAFHNSATQMADILRKCEGYLAQFDELSYLSKIKLASSFTDLNIVIEDLSKQLLTETRDLVISGRIKDLWKSPDDVGIFLFFLNKWISVYAPESYLEEVMAPKFINELNRYLHEEVNFEFRGKLAGYFSNIQEHPMNLVMTEFISGFIHKL